MSRILLLPLVLVPVGLLLGRAGVDFGQAGWNVLSFVILILPVTVWLSWWEAAPRGAALGKRWQKLRVVDAHSGELVGFGRTLLRNTFKVAVPWELGHTVAFGFAAAFMPSSSGSLSGWLLGVTIICYGLIIVWLGSLFIASGRTPYDRLSGTTVVPTVG